MSGTQEFICRKTPKEGEAWGSESQELLSETWEGSSHPMTGWGHRGAARETCQLIPLGRGGALQTLPGRGLGLKGAGRF